MANRYAMSACNPIFDLDAFTSFSEMWAWFWKFLIIKDYEIVEHSGVSVLLPFNKSNVKKFLDKNGSYILIKNKTERVIDGNQERWHLMIKRVR